MSDYAAFDRSPGRVFRPALTPFVGRQHELAVTSEWLEEAQAGGGMIGLLSGEPGSGKSRLLMELARQARESGCFVLSGRAYEMQGMPPYLPFVEALTQYLNTVTVEQDSERVILSRLVSFLTRMTSHESSIGGNAEPANDRYLLFENVANALISVSARAEWNGLLLCLDDLHWADKSTLLLCQHLARQLSASRLLVVATYRKEEVERNAGLADLLADLTRERLAGRLELPALHDVETRQLIEAMTGEPVSEDVAIQIRRRAEGNPFFIEEVARQLLAEGFDLSHVGKSMHAIQIPEGVIEVVSKRLSRLNRETYQLLQAAAVLGEEFKQEILDAMQVVPTDRFIDCTEEALSSALLYEDGDGLRFSHALIRETLLAKTSPARRHNLHARAADAVETLDSDAQNYVSALAFHLREADTVSLRSKAIEYSIKAGEQAIEIVALENAAEHWEGALRLVEQARDDRLFEARLLERLGDLYYGSDYYAYLRSRDRYERAIRLYRQFGELQDAARTHAKLATVLGTGNITFMDHKAARENLVAARALISPDSPDDCLIALLRSEALLACWDMRTADGLVSAASVLAIAERTNNEELRVVGLLHRGTHLVADGRLREGIAVLNESWRLADTLNRPHLGYSTTTWTAERLLSLMDPKAAEVICDREISKPRQAQTPSRRDGIAAARAGALSLSGRLTEANDFVRDAVTNRQTSLRAELNSTHLAWTWGSFYGFYADETPEIVEFWTGIEASARALDYAWMLSSINIRIGTRLARSGDTSGAIEALEVAINALRNGRHLPLELAASTELALAYADSGRTDEAQCLVESCRQIATDGEDWRGLAGMLQRAEAVLAAAQGLPQQADQFFAEAAATFQRLCLPWEEAETAFRWGRASGAYRAIQASAATTAHFDTATAIYRRFGAAESWLRRIEQERRRRPDLVEPMLHPNSLKSAYPDGLSGREAEILQLITAGKSNREIAERLVLSIRTVERHIANVYAKTGTHNRAQATDYAHRNHLIDGSA